MRSLILAAALLLVSASPTFADDEGGGPVAVTDADNGSTVSVQSGETLTLTLPTNGGIPYTWQLQSDVAPQLNFDGQDTVAATPGRLGGAANVVFTFTAGDVGETTLTASLMPVGGGDATKTVSVKVDVTQ